MEEGNTTWNTLTNATSLGKLLSECFLVCNCGRDSDDTNTKKKKKKPHKDTCAKNTNTTHTLMDGGTLSIPKEKRREFRKRYDREIWVPHVRGELVDSPLFGNKQCDTLVEKIGDGCYRMYFDLDIPTVGPSAMNSRELKTIAREFTSTMRSLLDSSIDLALVTYSCKPKYKPNARGEMVQQMEEGREEEEEIMESSGMFLRKKWKNGLHIHYPLAIVDKTLNRCVMDSVLPLLQKEHPNRLWEEWMDPECWNTGLRIDGCRKALRGPGGIMCYENERYSPLIVSSSKGAEEERRWMEEMKLTSEYLMVLPLEQEQASIREELWDPSLLEVANQSREGGTVDCNGVRDHNTYLAIDDVIIPMLRSRLELDLGYYTESIGKSSPSCYLFSPTTNEVNCPLGGFQHVSHGCSIQVLADGMVSFRCLSKRCKQYPSRELRKIDLNDTSLEEFLDGNYLVFESFTPAFRCNRKNATSVYDLLRTGVQLEGENIQTSDGEEYLHLKVGKKDVTSWGTRYKEIVPIATREGKRLPLLSNLLADIQGTPFPLRAIVSIRSPIDTGKTTMIRRYLQDAEYAGVPIERVLMISVRQSMTDDLVRNFGPFGFVEYRDFQNDSRTLRQQKRLILQIDSLHRLKPPFDGGSLPTYDMVVFDEVSYGLQHFSYNDMENKVSNLQILEHYIRTTNRVITMDADHGYKATDFLTEIRKDFTLIWNISPPPTRKHVIMYHRKGKWIDTLYDTVRRGGRIAVSTNSKRTAKAIKDNLIRMNLVTEDRVLLICSESTKEEKDLLKDCNTNFPRFDVLIYTPSIGPGVDFHEEHFDHLFAYGVRNSNTATDFVQGISRIRRTQTIHFYASNDRSPRNRDLVTAASLTKYISWSVDNYKEKLQMEPLYSSIDPETQRQYFPYAEKSIYFRLAFNNQLDEEDSRIRFRAIVREKFEAMQYVVEEEEQEREGTEEEKYADAEKDLGRAEKEVTKRKHEEIMSVEVTERPPAKSARRDEPITAAQMAFHFNEVVSVRDGHRIRDFYERHKGLSHIFKATRMLQTDEEAERDDLDRLNRDPTLIISGGLKVAFRKCVQDVLDIYGWKSIFDQKEIEPPNISKWNEHPNRREICQTLKLDESKRYKDAMGPIRAVLKKHFLLKIVLKQSSHTKGATKKYFINKENQQELYQLLRNKHNNRVEGTRLEEMETNGSFVVDGEMELNWLRMTTQYRME